MNEVVRAVSYGDIALESNVAVVGKTGAGKTSVEKFLTESAVWAPDMYVRPNTRVCILDTIKSDHWGLTLMADGKRPGLPFIILGGPHGHVPLHDGAGEAIAKLVATGQLPLSIIDMAGFKMGGLQRFWNAFAETLFALNKYPLQLQVEEAHEIAPKERSGVGAETYALYWAKKVATGGRSKGLRLTVATQRTQSIHNAMLGSCETMIALRLTAPADIEPIAKWLSANLEKDEAIVVKRSLPSLKNGEAWVCANGHAKRVQFPLFRTFDNSKTPDGSEIDVVPPKVDRRLLTAMIGDAVKEAEENDVDTLKARIKELETTVNATTCVSEIDINGRCYKAGMEEGHHSGYRRGMEEAANGPAARVVEEVVTYLERITARVRADNTLLIGPDASARPGGKDEPAAASPPLVARRSADPIVAHAHTPATPRRVSKGEGESGPSPKRKVDASGAGMRLFAELEKYFPTNSSFTNEHMLIMSGMRQGGYFNTAKGWLVSNEYIRQVAGGYEITVKGANKIGTLGDQKKDVRTRKLIGEIWLPKLKRPADEVLRVLLDQRTHASFAPLDMQARVGVKQGGYWNTAMKSLRDANLVDTHQGITLSHFVTGLIA